MRSNEFTGTFWIHFSREGNIRLYENVHSIKQEFAPKIFQHQRFYVPYESGRFSSLRNAVEGRLRRSNLQFLTNRSIQQGCLS